MNKWLAALPIYNEADFVDQILAEVSKYADNILVINDGSTDGTNKRLSNWEAIHVIEHGQNLGYGAALQAAFEFAIENDYEYLITLDCDGQHQPKRIPRFVSACGQADIVSGSRYLKSYQGDSLPPSDRLFINRTVTRTLNQKLRMSLTDAFCGFKAYRVAALKALEIQENGYAMPLELWVQAAMRGMRIIEVPIPLIYLDLSRSFGGALDEAETRLRHYNEVIENSIASMQHRGFRLPEPHPACQSFFP